MTVLPDLLLKTLRSFSLSICFCILRSLPPLLFAIFVSALSAPMKLKWNGSETPCHFQPYFDALLIIQSCSGVLTAISSALPFTCSDVPGVAGSITVLPSSFSINASCCSGVLIDDTTALVRSIPSSAAALRTFFQPSAASSPRVIGLLYISIPKP